MIKNPEESQGKLWIATVTLQTVNDKYSDSDPQKNAARNRDRMVALLRIVAKLSSDSKDNGVILFPGGWFHNGEEPAELLFPYIEKKIRKSLTKISSHIVVSLGVDGSIDEYGYDVDQLAIAVDKTGLIAISRKFQVLTKRERERVRLSPDYLQGELGKPRIFSLNGIRFYPAICYDTYGPQQKKLKNPGIDVIISHVHYFVPLNEKGPKGVVDFVRKGFAGSSAQWGVPIFGAGIFIRRPIPESWRTGMYYRSFPKPYLKCTIDENSLKPDLEFEDTPLKEGKVVVLKYYLSDVIVCKDSKTH